jgi:hypothetical protein
VSEKCCPRSRESREQGSSRTRSQREQPTGAHTQANTNAHTQQQTWESRRQVRRTHAPHAAQTHGGSTTLGRLLRRLRPQQISAVEPPDFEADNRNSGGSVIRQRCCFIFDAVVRMARRICSCTGGLLIAAAGVQARRAPPSPPVSRRSEPTATTKDSTAAESVKTCPHTCLVMVHLRQTVCAELCSAVPVCASAESSAQPRGGVRREPTTLEFGELTGMAGGGNSSPFR